MSTKLVKRLLQSTLEIQDEVIITTTKQKTKKKRKRKDDEKKTDASTSTNFVDPIQEKVNSILLWDRAFQSNDEKKNTSLKRKLKEQKRERKKSTIIVSTNSRSSSAKRQKVQPTITKKLLAEKQKLKSVQELAEALHKTKRKNKKSSKNN